MVEQSSTATKIQLAGWLALMAGYVLARLPIAVFFGFVGFHKAFASTADLTRYGSWTIHIPEPLGRAVGISEMACALLLVLPRWSRAKHAKAARLVAAILVANQLIAVAVHAANSETNTLAQNGALIAILLFIIWVSVKLERKLAKNSERE